MLAIILWKTKKEKKHTVRVIEFGICFRVITSGTRCTNCRASMEWLAVTRCPCRLVLTSSGSTYAEKYARYVEFRLSFSALRLFPEALFFAVHCNIHGSATRTSTDPSHGRRISFPLLFLSSLYNVHPLCIVASLLFRSFAGRNREIPYVSGYRRSVARPLKTGTIHVTNGSRPEFMVISRREKKRNFLPLFRGPEMR